MSEPGNASGLELSPCAKMVQECSGRDSRASDPIRELRMPLADRDVAVDAVVGQHVVGLEHR